MKTGWLKDASGKWYYLNAGGDMAKNTTVDGYKIGADGVCVGK
jgi:glucan-binding YG repeat protein